VPPILNSGGLLGLLSMMPLPLRISEFPLLIVKMNGDAGALELNSIVPTVVFGASMVMAVLVPAALLKVATLVAGVLIPVGTVAGDQLPGVLQSLAGVPVPTQLMPEIKSIATLVTILPVLLYTRIG